MATPKKEATEARWLEKDGKIELHADSAAAKADGWAEPKGVRSNGAPWNPEPIEGVTPQAEFAARLQTANAEVEAKRAQKKAAADEAAREEVEPVPPAPDFRVAIVEEPEPAKPAKAKKAAKRR